MTSSIDVVFVSTNESNVLCPAIESLLSAEPEGRVTIYVVDNNSRDGTFEKVKEAWPDIDVLVRKTNHGLPSNLNMGIKAGTSRYVMLCNSDLVFGSRAVSRLAEFLDATPKAGIAAPKLLAPDGTPRPSARRWYNMRSLLALKGPWNRFFRSHPIIVKSTYGDWDMSYPKSVDWVPCPATMFRRSALEEVGLIDERFRLYFDDVDISLRMHQAGWEVWCVPSAEVVHLEQRSSLRPFSKAWRWHLASLAKFWWKHRGLKPRLRGEAPKN